MSKHTNITRRIGSVFVDSGQMMLGDPCYLEGWQGHDFASDRPGEYSYAGACTASLSDDSAGIIGTDHRGPREGMAAVFSTIVSRQSDPHHSAGNRDLPEPLGGLGPRVAVTGVWVGATSVQRGGRA